MVTNHVSDEVASVHAVRSDPLGIPNWGLPATDQRPHYTQSVRRGCGKEHARTSKFIVNVMPARVTARTLLFAGNINNNGSLGERTGRLSRRIARYHQGVTRYCTPVLYHGPCLQQHTQSGWHYFLSSSLIILLVIFPLPYGPYHTLCLATQPRSIVRSLNHRLEAFCGTQRASSSR